MVAPVTRRTDTYTSETTSRWREWGSQVPPFTLRLSCSLLKTWAKVGDSRSWSVGPDDSPLRDVVSNKARERLVAQLGDVAQLGASIAAEWRGSVDMISKRAIQIAKFANSLRKGRLGDAAAILNVDAKRRRSIEASMRRKGITRLSRRRIVVRDFGSAWLEYSYGWGPLVQDIYTASQVIEKPPRNLTIKGRASQETERKLNLGGTWLEDKWVHKVSMIVDVEPKSHNTHLANQLGLTNPASWLLEGIPFSFVLDWFSNLSQWVSQLTDFVGLTLLQPMTTHNVTYEMRAGYVYWGNKYPAFDDKGFHRMKREPGIPPVRLVIGLEPVNWKRGLNAISLLTQALSTSVRR